MLSSGGPSWAAAAVEGPRAVRACPRPSLLLGALAVLLLALLAMGSASLPGLPGAAATSLCRPLPEPEDCPFGPTRDFCGRVVCAKGPGERCGGPSHVHGRCGEGTHCKCGRCIGCSLLTFTCDLGGAVCV